MWHHFMGSGHMFSGFGLLLNILIVAIAIAMIAGLFRSKNSKINELRDTRDSLEILKLRLAKDEISEDEYTRIKQHL